MKKLGRRLFRKVARVFIVLAVLGLAVLLVPRVLLFLQVRAARSEGLPLTPADLPILAQNDSKNAAGMYEKANALLQTTLERQHYFCGGIISFPKFPTPGTIRSDMQAMSCYAPAMRQAETASVIPELAYERKWDDGFKVRMPEFDCMRDFAILEVKTGGLLAAKGDTAGALKCIETAEHISYHIGLEPDLKAAYDFAKTQSEIDRTVVDLLSHVDRSPAFVAGLRTLFDGLPKPHNLQYYCRGQMVMDLATLRQLPNYTDDDYDEILAGVNIDARVGMQHLLKNAYLNPVFEASFISYYRGLLSSLPEDETNWPQLQSATVKADEIGNGNSIQNSATSVLSKPMYMYGLSQEKIEVNRRLIQVALRLLQQEETAKALPKSLPDYGKVGIDPFSAKAFDYSSEGDGFVLSGIGPIDFQKVMCRIAPAINNHPV